MEIKIAQYCGFCYGVKRAVNLALQEAGQNQKVATYGPLIHNPQMIEGLKQLGVDCKENLEDFQPGEKIILRSHGVGPEVYDQIQTQGLQLIDATCPNVRNAQQRAHRAVLDGFLPIIIGEKDHPEVKSIKKWAGKHSFVVEYIKDIVGIPPAEKYAVIIQTTFEKQKFERLLAELQLQRPGEYRVEHTICNATAQRQEAAMALATEVDAMVVIGGRNSANTRHLADLVREKCHKVFHIETAAELNGEMFKGCTKIGITAGASTPDRLIKEAFLFMENLENKESFEALLEESMEGVSIYPGKVVDAEVIQMDKDGVYVAFGYMREGFIPYNEWSVGGTAEELMNVIKIGDKVEAKIVLNNAKDEFIRMSKIRAEREAAWKTVQPLAEGEKRAATVKVLRVIKNKMKNVVGLSVAVEDVEGFMPASHIELRRVEDFDQYVGKELPAEIIEVDLEKRRIVVSRRDMLKAEKEEKARLWKEQKEARIAAAREARIAAAEAAMASIEEGSIVTGKVVKVVEFGLFVEIAKGLVGLVHSTELSWERGVKPADVAKEGDEVQVKVKKIDKEEHRVALTIKGTMEDPWRVEASQLQIGDVLEGTVVRFLAFGAIVKLSDKVEGLVHVSEISEDRVNKPEDVLEIGQEVKVAVLKMDLDAKKIGLSIVKAKQLVEQEGYENYMDKGEGGLTADLSDKFEK